MKHVSRATTVITVLTALCLLVSSSLSAAARASPNLVQDLANATPTAEPETGGGAEADEQGDDDSGGWLSNAMDIVIDTGGDIVGGAKDTTVSAAGTVWDVAQDAPGAVWGAAEHAPGAAWGAISDGWNWLRHVPSGSITWEGWAAFLVDHPVLGTLLGPLMLLLIGLSPDGSISYLDIALAGLLLLVPAAKGIQMVRDIAAPFFPRLSRGEEIVGTIRRTPGLLQLDLSDLLAFLRARTIKPTMDLIAKLPTSPGVYIVMDADGTPIYVGMSNSIKRRLTEHFTPPRSKFADDAASIKIIPRSSPASARALECRLIKAFMPKYNEVHVNDHPCPVYFELLSPVQP